jgi:hypothetical protein
MAALVAVASDAQPAQPADAAVQDEAPSDRVRQIDFKGVAQPGAACNEGVSALAPRLIPVAAGASEVLDEQSFARLEVGDVLYGDLDGDGSEEAVVHTVCNYGANGRQDTVQVWALNGRLPMLVDSVSNAPGSVSDDSSLPPSVQSVALDGGELLITYSHFADDDPHCCPSELATVAYALDGGLEAVGDPEITDAENAAP